MSSYEVVEEGRRQGKGILGNENSVCRGSEHRSAEPAHRLEWVSVHLEHGVVKARPGEVNGKESGECPVENHWWGLGLGGWRWSYGHLEATTLTVAWSTSRGVGVDVVRSVWRFLSHERWWELRLMWWWWRCWEKDGFKEVMPSHQVLDVAGCRGCCVGEMSRYLLGFQFIRKMAEGGSGTQ